MSHMGKPVTRQIKEQRQKEAKVRQDEYDALTLQQKLDKLPDPPASKRQRDKLLAQCKPVISTATTERGTVAFGVLPPPGWEGLIGKTVEEIDQHFKDKNEGDKGPKKLRAKERRAQEKH